jgi:hypothetical protein
MVLLHWKGKRCDAYIVDITGLIVMQQKPCLLQDTRALLR